jgi:methyl-accepting chemotaxis protein
VIVPPPTTPAAGGGGGAAAPTPVAADNLAAWQADQIKNVDNQLIDALDWLDDILDRAFLGLAITVASYDAYIEILVLHLSDATKADITKVIGEVIKAISKILKIAVDKAMALKDKALAALTNTTELPNYGPPHIHFTKKHEVKATHGALTKIQGYFTDDIDNVGKYIEQIGEFLNDVTDIRFDLQEISFSFASLDAQIAEFVSLIDHTFERIDETIVAADTTKEGLLQKYEEQAMNKLNDIAESTGFNDLIEEGTAFANTIDKSMASISDQVADAGIAIVPSSLRSLAAAPPVGGIA